MFARTSRYATLLIAFASCNLSPRSEGHRLLISQAPDGADRNDCCVNDAFTTFSSEEKRTTVFTVGPLPKRVIPRSMVNLEWDRPMLLKAEEKRNVERYRMLKAGSIVFGGGVIDCVVRNLSEAGAALEVASPVGIPNTFALIHGSDVRRDCTVVWRSGSRVGVGFS